MTRVKGAGDTRRRRAQRLRNGHFAAPPSPPCTCTGPCDHGTANGPPPSPPPPPERRAPTRHCSRPRFCFCVGPCDHGAMDGGPPCPPRPRAMPPRFVPRLPYSGPPPLGRRDGRPHSDCGRPPLQDRYLCPPRLGRRQPDADHGDPDERRVLARHDDGRDGRPPLTWRTPD